MSAHPESAEAFFKESSKASLRVAGAADSLGWLRTVLLLVWALASFGLMFFARDLQMRLGTWPVSFWLASQGLLVVFVLIVFVYAWAANRAESRVDRAEHSAEKAKAPP
jgi:putative solute:sodium symporter small subunit